MGRLHLQVEDVSRAGVAEHATGDDIGIRSVDFRLDEGALTRAIACGLCR